MSGGRRGEGDDRVAELDQKGDLGVRAQRVGRGDDDAEGEEGEVEDRDADGVRGENESGVAFGESDERPEIGG